MSLTDHFIARVASVRIDRGALGDERITHVLRIEISDTDGGRHQISLHSAEPIRIAGDVEVPEEDA